MAPTEAITFIAARTDKEYVAARRYANGESWAGKVVVVIDERLLAKKEARDGE